MRVSRHTGFPPHYHSLPCARVVGVVSGPGALTRLGPQSLEVLRRYFSKRSGFTALDMDKIWLGLFYCARGAPLRRASGMGERAPRHRAPICVPCRQACGWQTSGPRSAS